MKRQFVLVTFLVLVAARAMAQGPSSFTLSAHIPFDFVVRGDTLPAGDYMLRVSSPTPGPMMVRQRRGNRAEFVLQVPVTENWTGPTQLTFQRLGDTYYLVEVSDRRSGIARVQQGDRFHEASRTASAQTITIAAK